MESPEHRNLLAGEAMEHLTLRCVVLRLSQVLGVGLLFKLFVLLGNE